MWTTRTCSTVRCGPAVQNRSPDQADLVSIHVSSFRGGAGAVRDGRTSGGGQRETLSPGRHVDAPPQRVSPSAPRLRRRRVK